MIRSSSRYLTLWPRAISRLTMVELTSFETQFVIRVMLRRCLVNRSELKMNCSGLEPLRVITTRPCWPNRASSCKNTMNASLVCHLVVTPTTTIFIIIIITLHRLYPRDQAH